MFPCVCVCRTRVCTRGSVAGTSAAFSQGEAGGKGRVGERRQSQYGPGGAQTPATSQCEMSPAAHGVRARRARRRGVGVDVDVMLHLAPRGRRGRRRRASIELPPSFDNFSATENFPNFHQNPHTIWLCFYMRVRDSSPKINRRSRWRTSISTLRFVLPVLFPRSMNYL